MRGLFLEGLIFRGANLGREICASKLIGLALYIVEDKFTVFALLYFVFEGNFPSISPRGAYIWRGDLLEVFLRYRFGGLVHGGPLAYFRNFTVYLMNGILI